MLLDTASAGLMVQMAVVQVVDVVFMLDRGVAALCAVLVIVICVLMAHFWLLLVGICCWFAAVCKSVFDQELNVCIRQPVEDVLSLPPLLH